MLKRSMRKGLLCGVLFLLGLAVVLDSSREHFAVREGIESTKDSRERCDSEADNWVDSTDFGTNENFEMSTNFRIK